MLTDAQASSRSRASRFRASNCVCVGESINLHDALFDLEREPPYNSRRVQQISFDTFQTCEVCAAAQASAMSGRSGAMCASLADMVWLAFCPSSYSSSRFSGAVVRSAWRHLGSSVARRLEPSFATRASRVPTSFLTRCTSHSDSTPLPRCRILVPILPSAPVLASRSVSAMTNRRRHKMKSSRSRAEWVNV